MTKYNVVRNPRFRVMISGVNRTPIDDAGIGYETDCDLGFATLEDAIAYAERERRIRIDDNARRGLDPAVHVAPAEIVEVRAVVQVKPVINPTWAAVTSRPG